MKTLILTLLTAPLAFANPFQPETIPATANWYLHGDLTMMRETNAGGLLVKLIRKDQAEALAEIENILEFDPLTDLTGLTAFGNGKKEEGALVLRGKFDRTRIEEVITYADNYKTTRYGTTTLHHWDDKGKTQHAAFHGNRTLVISQQENLLQLGLDVLAKEKPGLPADLKLPAEDPTLVAFANISKIDLPNDEGSRIVRRAKSLMVTMGEKEDRLQMAMIAETDSAQTSRRMLSVMEGVVALGQLTDENIEALEIRHEGQVTGTAMTMSMSLSTTKALEILSQLK